MPSGRAAAVPSDDEDAAASPSPTILLHPRHHRRKEETDESSDEDDDDASESSSGESYHEHKRRHRHHPRRRRRRHSSRAIIVAPQNDNTLLIVLTLLLILMVGGVTAYLLYQRAKPSSAPSSSGGGTGTPSKPSGSGVAATPSSSSSSSSSSDNSATSEFAKNALDAHNSVRATHGAPDFTYNDTLASAADKWAHVCEWEHSGGKVGPYGENLFMVYPSSHGLTTPQSGIQSWADEESMYDYDDPGFDHETGHFTQVVWVGTLQVGCAYIDCDAGTLNDDAIAAYLVCEYYPAGNIVNEGEFEKNVLRPS